MLLKRHPALRAQRAGSYAQNLSSAWSRRTAIKASGVSSPRRRLHVVVRAEKDDSKGAGGSDKDKSAKELEEQIRKQGVDAAVAKKILKVWKDAGAESPEQLKRIFMKGSMKPLTTILFQAALDVGACVGGFATSGAVRQAPDFPGKLVVEAIFLFLGWYFAVGAISDLFTLGTLLGSTVRFGTNAEVFVQAIESIAGSNEQPGLIGKVTKAVNSVKVVNALLSIIQILKEEAGAAEDEQGDTLNSLSAYFTLSQAEELFAFRPEAYGLTAAEAAQIATIFVRFDRNGDYKLEAREIQSLCASLGKDLTDEESQEAIKILDADESGFVDFPEFVAWWTGKVSTNLKE